MTWLVACFEPFGGATTNSSALVQAELAKVDWSGRVRFAPPLPVTFADAWPTLGRLIESDPTLDGVLTLGQAAGRARVNLECLAVNLIDTDRPDNAGAIPPFGPVEPGAERTRWSSVDWQRASGVTGAERSYSAGTFVCNAVFFASLGWAEAHGKRAAFIHIPALSTQPEFARVPRVDAREPVAAVRGALEFLTAP